VVNAVIQSISRFEDGDVKSIQAISQNGHITIQHSVNIDAPTTIESSMKPFVANVHEDKPNRLLVSFKGHHSLKITVKSDGEHDKVSRLAYPPSYRFHNNRGIPT
jgi:hypothetical protein